MVDSRQVFDKDIYYEATQRTACAYALHEAVYDENDRMVDYIFLDVNRSFEELTGLKREDVLNKRYLADIATNIADESKWVQFYERVIKERRVLELNEHSEQFDKYYSIRAYFSGENRFTTLFNDRTAEYKMQSIAQYFVRNMGKSIDFEKLTEFACNIAGARFGVLNLLDEKDSSLTIVSTYGTGGFTEGQFAALGLKEKAGSWINDPIIKAKLAEEDIAQFSSLADFADASLDKIQVTEITESLDLGIVVLALIKKDTTTIGDITLFFDHGHKLKNPHLLRLYVSQMGLFIEKNRLDIALRASQKMFFELAEYAPIGFLSCDTEGNINYVNRKLLELMDSPDSTATKRINLFELPALRQSGFSDKLRECMREDRLITHEMCYTSIWGKNNWLRVHFSPNKEHDAVIGAHIVTDDITERKHQEAELLERVQSDPLTKAYNRNVLETTLPERLNISETNGFSACVAILDFDDFKKVNDTYGHKAGDTVLRYLAMRIIKELREDDLLIRTGGDEFLFYLHNIKDQTNAAKTIERIFRKVSGEYRLDNITDREIICLDLSCSIGASMFPENGKTVDILMAKADKVLYEVKKEGKADYGFFS